MRRSRSICPSVEASKAIAQELVMLQKEERETQMKVLGGLEEEVEEAESLSSEDGGLHFASSRVFGLVYMVQFLHPNTFLILDRFLLQVQGNVWKLKTTCATKTQI